VNEKPSVLVVEDDDDCRTVLQDLLEMSGYRVVTCPDARRPSRRPARLRQPSCWSTT
jgi:CheY-like chemotaxis protein